MSEFKLGHIEPFWGEEYKWLNYRKETFNNEEGAVVPMPTPPVPSGLRRISALV